MSIKIWHQILPVHRWGDRAIAVCRPVPSRPLDADVQERIIAAIETQTGDAALPGEKYVARLAHGGGTHFCVIIRSPDLEVQEYLQ